jgi:hypothetical protein
MVGVPLTLQLHLMHVDGVDNKVADCLSCYYKNDMSDESHPEHIYVNTDVRLDPDGELLPTNRKTAAMRQSNHLVKKREAQIIDSKEMNDSARRALPEVAPPSIDGEDILVTAMTAQP